MCSLFSLSRSRRSGRRRRRTCGFLLPTSTLVPMLVAAMVMILNTPSSAQTTSSFSGVETFELNDGNVIPKVGLGVFRADPGTETYDSVRWALALGYRHIDTAVGYRNEADVGRAVHDSGIPRSQIYITTKIDGEGHGYREAIEQFDGCLRRLRTNYVDLVLIHSPYGGRIVETYDALLQIRKSGKARSIGVSNFGVKHLEALSDRGRATPSVNQIEMHPLIYSERSRLVEHCRENGILIVAYGSLFSGNTDRYGDGPLPRIAASHPGRSVPQVLLRWAVQRGFAVIPKSSSSKSRQEENVAILDFELTEEEMEALDGMAEEEEGLDAYWDPVNDADVDVGDLSHGGRDGGGDGGSTEKKEL